MNRRSFLKTAPAVVSAASLMPISVGAMDDAFYVQRLIDRCARYGGGTVFLANGVYHVCRQIVVRPDVTLAGEKVNGLHATWIVGDGSVPAALKMLDRSGLDTIALRLT